MTGPRRRLPRVARRLPVTCAYVAAVVVATACLRLVDPGTRSAVLHAASTNLDNLEDGRWDVLVTSALVVVPPALPVVLVDGPLLAVGELVLGSRRLVAVFAAGHALASLLVAALLEADLLPGVAPVDVRSAVDVGLSYGALSVLGCLLVARPRRPARWVLPAAALVVVPLLVRAPTFTSWGHVFALSLGLALGAGARSCRSAGPLPGAGA